MSWLFSQALVEEYSEANCLDGVPSAQLNVMPSPQAFWHNDKTMEDLKPSPFGLTLQLLTADRGAELLMWFLAGFPAKTSVLPEKARDSMVSDPAYGWKWPESSTKYNPDSRSWKTRQCSLLGGLEPFSETWPRWGTMRNGECWERQTWERHISGSESGFWRTPKAQDGGRRGNYKDKVKLDIYLQKGHTLDLCEQVRWPHLWPTPTVCGNYNRKGASKTSGDGLATAVGGTLNPAWVEWLMGWPIGWTELEPLAMDKCRSVMPRLGVG
jgi:hypothetical protein